MADFMTVLAANQGAHQGAHGGKTAAAGRMPAGFFSELLSAQFEAPALPPPVLQAPALTGASLKLTADVALAAEDAPASDEASDAATDPGAAGLLAPLFNPAAVELAPVQKAASPAAPEGQALPRLAALPAAERGERAGMTAAARNGDIPGLAAEVRAQPEGLAGALQATTGNEEGWTEALAVSEQAPADVVALTAPAGKLEPDDPSLLGVNRQAGAFDLRSTEATPRLGVEAPVHSRAFRSEFAEKVVWLAGQQTQSAELTLNPQHLGALEVRLSLSGGEAGAQFYSPHPAVRDAIEAAMSKLREMLAEAGISLGDAQVRDEAFQRREGRPAPQAAAPGDAGASVTSGVLPVAAAVRTGLGLVDLYA